MSEITESSSQLIEPGSIDQLIETHVEFETSLHRDGLGGSKLISTGSDTRETNRSALSGHYVTFSLLLFCMICVLSMLFSGSVAASHESLTSAVIANYSVCTMVNAATIKK